MAQVKKISRLRIFWIFHTAGWSLLTALIIVLYVPNISSQPEWAEHYFWRYFIGYFVCLFLAYFYSKTSFRIERIKKDISLSVFIYVIGVHLWFALEVFKDLYIITNLEFPDPLFLKRYLHDIFYNLLYLMFWSATFFGVKFWLDLSEQKAESEYADALLKDSRLRMLRYQLNPHFLFNSLNSIRALLSENTNRAVKMINELSLFLRYSLTPDYPDRVPLREELRSIDHYLSIEKMRYEEKLELNRMIEDSSLDYPILSFLIHPVIENAVKFGMLTSSMPLRIRISASVSNGSLILEISNTGKWINPDIDSKNTNSGTGTGLNNIRMRLENAYPGNHSMITKEEDGKATVTIEINRELNYK